MRAAWLVNPGETPRQNVRVTIVDNVVQEVSELKPDERALAAPVALLPRFVNAHAHLEFSSLTAPLGPAQPFTEWIRSVVRYRSEEMEDCRASISAGFAESIREGTAVVGEICTSDAGLEAFAECCRTAEASGVCFRELIGFGSDSIDDQIHLAEQYLNAASAPESAAVPAGRRFVRGLSPHAPYSVHPELFDAATEMAVRHGVPIAMHLAETADELQFLERGTGSFTHLLRSFGIWDETVLSPGTKPIRYLEKLAQARHALAVHGNYFGPEEIQFLSRHTNVATVYCPRTHAGFGHPPHPWQELRAVGATVILGTDGRCSNPDLSVWKELQLAAATASEPVWKLLPMVTTTAASALGLDPAPFVISPGQPFHCVMAASNASSQAQLQADLLTLPVVPESL